MPSQTPPPPAPSLFVSADSLRVRLDWFNRLRWGAVACVLVAVLLADRVASQPLPVGAILATTGVLFLLNAGYVVRNARLAPTSVAAELRLVKLQMVGDLVALTVLLNLSGGVENPLLFVYVVHVIIGSLLFKGREIYAVAWLAILLFTGAALGEYLGVLPHHHLLSASAMTHELPYVLATLASFWLVLLASAFMGASIMRHNRAIRDELVERQHRLEETDRAKMAFFRFVTHEVKTPVNTARSAVEAALAVADDGMSAEVRDLLQRAVGRLGQATDMVKNLADLTRGGLRAGDPPRTLDLTALVQGVAADLREEAARTGQEIAVETPGAPVVITSHQPLLEKIAANLVGNAVRYNREGGRVRVRLEDQGDTVYLEVGDQGIGIAPEDQARVFEEFYRTEEARRRSSLGTGLGLSIVKRFVDQLGGRIEVSSTPGAGATFRVALPRRSGTAGPSGGEAGAVAADGGTT